MRHALVLLCFGALLMSIGVAAAQDDTPDASDAKTVTVAPGITVDATQPFVLYVDETVVNSQGSFAGVRAYLLPVDGAFVRLTPCDDIVVACAPMHLRVEGVSQGDRFVLAPYDGGH